MLEFIFTIGQAASALLLIYGAYLVLMPPRKAPALSPPLEDELILVKHLHTDA